MLAFAGGDQAAAEAELADVAADLSRRAHAERAARGAILSPPVARLALREIPPAFETTEARAARAEREARRAEQHRESTARQAQAALTAAVGIRYRDSTLETFQPPTPAASRVLEDLRGYVDNLAENVAEGVGIVLLGPPGTGKDHLIVAVLRAAAIAGHSVKWVDGCELYGSARDNIDVGQSESDWARRYTSPDILAISDPIPPVGEVREGFQISTLFRIVDRRYRDKRPTMITINVADAAEASRRMSANIVDRLSHGALVLQCAWPSYRKPMR